MFIIKRTVPGPAICGVSLRLVLAASILAVLSGCPGPSAAPPELAVRADDHVLENGAPTVTVIEYANAECPHCGVFARDAFPTIRARYVDTGKIRWVYRDLPFTPTASRAAQASECAAAQDRFWEYLDSLYAHQSALQDDDLRSYAQALSLDLGAFDACLAGTAENDRVNEDVLSAVALGVTSTPTFFIGQKRVVGFTSLEDFTALLDQALAAAAFGGP